MKKDFHAGILKIALFVFAGLFHSNVEAQVPQLGRDNIKLVISAMTLQEKARLVVGMGFKFPGVPAPNGEAPKPIDIGGFTFPPTDPEAYSVPEKVPGSTGRTHAIPRLGIPSITFADGPAGVRIDPKRANDPDTYYATAFPCATLLASSWDTALVTKVGIAFGSEVRDYGIDIILAPALNIQRNPLGGRNFEYYSEDPLVSGSMAAAIVNGIQSNGVGTSIRHFAANNQETNRMQVNTVVSERALREIYLRGFERAVELAQPWTVMSSYNKINGRYTSESRDLLTTILRDEWGFKGFVITDFLGGRDAVAQMNAGNDWLLPGYPGQSDAIVAAVKNGSLSMAQLDANVAAMLTIIIKSPTFKGHQYTGRTDLPGHAEIARMAAAQGMVLLKDEEEALPLATGKTLVLFGNTSYNIIAGGTGSGDVNKAYTLSLSQGLKSGGYKVRESIAKSYEQYITDEKAKQPTGLPPFMALPPIAELEISGGLIEREADSADAAVITIGRNAGEWADRTLDNDFNLTDAERRLINDVSRAFHAKGKKVVVVLNIGGVIEVASWRNAVDAILLAWQPGQEGGNAIADVLSGKANPSGKLATTFPMKYQDVPSAKNFPGKDLPLAPGQNPNPITGRPAEVNYQEGIYVGYRYYDSFAVKPAYDFGYGLSYTQFEISDAKASSTIFQDSMGVSVTIKNTGRVAGKEVVQVYISAPMQNLDKPRQELKAYAKTDLLAPGQSQTLSFKVRPADLASFYTSKSAWVADAGEYKMHIGTSSRSIDKTLSFIVPTEILVKRTHKSLSN